MTAKPAPAPSGLGRTGAALWRSIARQVADDDLVLDARERRWLADACREADMLALIEADLRAAAKAGGLTVKGSQGQPTANALLGEARRSRAQVAQLLARIGLDDPESRGVSVGSPMTAAEAGRRGGFAKHYGNRSGMGGA